MTEETFGKNYSQSQLAVLAGSFPSFRISVDRKPEKKAVSKPVFAARSSNMSERKHGFLASADYGMRSYDFEASHKALYGVRRKPTLGGTLKRSPVEEQPVKAMPSEHKLVETRPRSFMDEEKIDYVDILSALHAEKNLQVGISKTQQALNSMNTGTRRKIKEFAGEFYDKNNYSSKIWDKIKETKIDLAWVSNLNNFEKDEFHSFLVPIRLMNEGVYWMDAFIEDKDVNDRQKILEAFRKKSHMYAEAVRYMNHAGKKDLTGKISQIMYAIDLHYANESFSQVKNSNSVELSLKQMGPAYEEFLEPSDNEYLDTGSYGTLFSEWFKMKDKRNFQTIWNNSRRATDVIDGLVDLKEDLGRGVFCPLTIYVFNQCPLKEKEVMLESFMKGTNGHKVEEIVQTYSRDLLNKTKNYVSNISPEYKNVRLFKERTLNTIDLGIGITYDLELFEQKYNSFYNKSLE